MTPITRTTTRHTAALAAFVLLGLTPITASASAHPDTATRVPGTATAQADATDGFDSPAAAARAYLSAMAASDLDSALAAFAVEQILAHSDLEATLDWMGAYSVTSGTAPFPATNDLNVAFNSHAVRNRVVQQILIQYATLTLPEHDPVLMTRVDDPAAFVAELEAAVTPDVYAGAADADELQLAELDADATEAYNSDRAAEQRQRLAGLIGADELAAVALGFDIEVGGEHHELVMVFEAARYGDGWWLYRLGGEWAYLADLPDSGTGVLVR